MSGRARWIAKGSVTAGLLAALACGGRTIGEAPEEASGGGTAGGAGSSGVTTTGGSAGGGGAGGSAGGGVAGGLPIAGGAGPGGFPGSGGVSTGGFPGAGGGFPTGGFPATGGGFPMGGFPGTGGSVMGGAGGRPMMCAPGAVTECFCADGTRGRSQCGSSGTWEPCSCEVPPLEHFRKSMTGEWSGIRTTPWSRPVMVWIVFRSDGTYSGFCETDCAPFDYGLPGEAPTNRYELTAIDPASASATGWLSVTFGPDNVQRGELRNVRFEEIDYVLTFEFWNTWTGADYGPVEFTLRRAP